MHAQRYSRRLYNIHASVFEMVKHEIAPLQHGFYEGRSTLTNLMEYTDFVANNMVRGEQTDSIYTDFAKAFDRVDRSILIRTLETFNLGTCIRRFILSYLSDRKQMVVFRTY